jgi:hypothetical protein
MPIDLLVEYTDGTTESFMFPYVWWVSKRKSNPEVKERYWMTGLGHNLIMILLLLKQKYDQENHYRSKRINGWCETGNNVF